MGRREMYHVLRGQARNDQIALRPAIPREYDMPGAYDSTQNTLNYSTHALFRIIPENQV